MQKKQRLFQYDFIRVIAMLMVLALHVELKTRYFRVDYNIPWYFSNSIIIFLIVCNPIFFMISGKFNLRCQLISISDYFDYYKKKFINIFIPFFSFFCYIICIKKL